MNTKDHLEKQFSRAGIPIKVSDTGFVRGLRGASDVTQIDIEVRGQFEQVRCFPGTNSEVKVMNVDKAHQQVVLSVLEPERTFTERQSVPWGKRDPETGKRYSWVERTTPKEERRLLIGMDERHLFISQMPDDQKPSSVRQAHENLAPAGIPGTKKRRKKEKIIRQGEFFFVPCTQEEIKLIKDRIKLTGTEKKAALGSDGQGRGVRGKPHRVKERIRINIKSEDDFRDVRGVRRLLSRTTFGWTSFVRGWVRHADHKTVKLRDWHRVSSNTENRSSTATWVD